VIDLIGLIFVLFFVPLLALGAAYRLESTMESKWREVQNQRSPAGGDSSAEMTLSEFCREARESREVQACGWYPAVGLLFQGAVIALAVGGALILGISSISRASRGNRTLLLLFFKPGLYITVLLSAGLMLLHAALFLGAIILGELTAYGRIWTGIFLLFIVGIGTAFGLVFLIRGVVVMMAKPKVVVIGRPIAEDRYPSIWKQVKALAAKINALSPNNIVVGLDASFFVIESPIKCLTGKLKGRTLYLSLPLCRILNQGELTAIVGHELGHFKGEDTRFTRRFAPIYRGAADALVNLERMRSEHLAAIALLPVLSVLSYFFDCFATAEKEIARERELAADQVGVTLSGSQNAASALVKVHAFSNYWRSALQRMRETINSGRPVDNVSAMFAELVAENAREPVLLGLEDKSLSHPMDTHPPLNVRLQAIGVSLKIIEGVALDISPRGSAVHMIDDYEKLEQQLSQAQQTLMERAGEVRVGGQKKCPACARPNPANADACACGLNFRRYLG